MKSFIGDERSGGWAVKRKSEQSAAQPQKTGVDRDVWLAAIADLHQAPSTDPNVLTAQEFMHVVDVGYRRAQRLLHALVQAGKAEMTKKFTQRADGVWFPMPAYRLKERPDAKRARS